VNEQFDVKALLRLRGDASEIECVGLRSVQVGTAAGRILADGDVGLVKQ
jgi:hypothetical protein